MLQGENSPCLVIFFVTAEAVNNMCGLGFNGYDENGKAKWNRVTNINILKVEVTFSFFSFEAGFFYILASRSFNVNEYLFLCLYSLPQV